MRKVVAFEVASSEQVYRKVENEFRKKCAYSLMDELLKMGAVDFATSESVTLCGCVGDSHDLGCDNLLPPQFAVRAMICIS